MRMIPNRILTSSVFLLALLALSWCCNGEQLKREWDYAYIFMEERELNAKARQSLRYLINDKLQAEMQGQRDMDHQLFLSKLYLKLDECNHAVLCLGRILRKNPRHEAGRQLFPYALARAGSEAAAIKYLLHLQEDNQLSHEHQLLLAGLYYRAGKREQALKILKSLQDAPERIKRAAETNRKIMEAEHSQVNR